MATIATVAALTGSGKAYAVNVQGVQRELKANDTLEKGETLKTVGDVQVELVSDDMRTLHVNPDQVVKLDDNVFQSEQTPTAADAAVTNTATTETIIQALDRGQDLSTTLEATAAGATDGGGGGGTTFVELGRISEGVTGNSYGFDYVGLGNLPITQGAATGSNPVVGITIDPITGDNIINNQESNATNTNITGSVSGDARVGDTVTVTVNGHEYTGTVTSGSNGLGFSIPVVTKDLVADPTITASITALGTSGVTATATVDVTVANDTLNARISIDQINGHGIISNTAEVVTITGKVKVEYSGNSGTGEEKVTLTIGGKEYVATIAADGTYSVKDVSVKEIVNEDGSVKEITATILASNTNGSQSTATTSTTPVYDNPTATVTITSVAGDNIVNNVEVQGPVAVVGTVGGSAKDGDTVTITVGSGENLHTYTGTVINGGFNIEVPGNVVAGQTITAAVSGTNEVGSTYSSSDVQDVAPGAALQSDNVALNETDAALTTGGTVTAAVATTFVAQSGVAGDHGTFNIDASGKWTYTANSAYNSLNVGEQVSDTFSVQSADGSVTSVTVTITGTNDAPTVEAALTAAGNEDSATFNVDLLAGAGDVDTGAVLSVTNLSTLPAGVTLGADGKTLVVDPSNAAFQHLAKDEPQDIVVTYKVTDQLGASTNQTATITINGTNDTATVSSVIKNLTEGNAIANISTSGKLTVTDPDTGEAHTVAQTSTAGAYGTFAIDTNGNWTYTASSAHNELTAGQKVTETFTVASKDGTGTGVVTINITGTNDTAKVSSATKNLTEGDTSAKISTNGKLAVTDPDTGEAHTVAQASKAGAYGTFAIDTNGNWTYTASSAHNELTAGQKVKETFIVKSQDGTGTGVVTINITGTNDKATVSSITKTLTEGDTSADISTSGKLTVTDPDAGEAHTIAQASKAGAYGTFAVDTNGNWTYTANSAHDELPAGHKVTETFTVQSQDGTGSGVVTINITGTNDAPVISSDSKTEGIVSAEDHVVVDGQEIEIGIVAGGQVIATDVDNGATLTFSADHVKDESGGYVGEYGRLYLDETTGEWGYLLDTEASKQIAADEIRTETFNVTVTDEHGASDTQTVTVKVYGSNDMPEISVNSGNLEDRNDMVYESGLVNGTDADHSAVTAQGTIMISDPDGLSDISELVLSPIDPSIPPTVITLAELEEAAVNNISVADNYGVLVIDGYANGVISYTYTLMSPLPSGDEQGSNVVAGGVNFTVTVNDKNGDSASIDLQIDVKDDAPVLNVTNAILRQSGDDQDAGGSNDSEDDRDDEDHRDDAQNSRYDDEGEGKQDNKGYGKEAQDSRYNDEHDRSHDEGEHSQAFTPTLATGTLVTLGADGGSVDWTTLQAPEGLTSHGEAVQYMVQGNMLGAIVPGDEPKVVFTLEAKSDGTYEFNQYAQLDIRGSEDESSSKELVFGFKATDNDGDTVSSQLTVTLQTSDDVDVPHSENHAMLGHEGSDTFQWSLGDHDHETVKNFDFKHEGGKGGDVLDLRDLLVGEHGGKGGEHDNLDNYLKFEVEDGKLELQVKHDGGIHDAGSHADKTIVLEGYHSKAELAHDIGCSSTSDMDLLKKLVETGHLKTDS